MKKICIVCNSEFDSTHTKGSEQKYCSSNCRTTASQQRQKEKIIQEYEKEKSEQTGNANMVSGSEQLSNIHGGQRENTGRYINEERNNNIFKQTTSSGDGYFFDLIERNYQTQNESNINKLKLELALKEIEQLTTRCSILENELEEIDEMDSVSGVPQNEYLASIVQQFKTDPQGTITMVKELIPLIPDIIGSLFKPKAA
jgi:hypothetical protein